MNNLSNLVTTHISQSFKSNFGFELYPVSVKIVRPSVGEIEKRGLRRSIVEFSWASKKNLRFAAANAVPPLVSQFGMTYHERVPQGWEVKRDLYRFLKALKRKEPGVKYLWILEFQKRQTVHLHLFLTLRFSWELQEFMAKVWNRITEPGNGKHLWWHLRADFSVKGGANFIPWEMRSAGYLTKYLDKEHQKRVPEGFKNVGRFWGSSNGLVPSPEKISELDLYRSFSAVDSKAPKRILRILCKSQEKKVYKKKWKNFAKRTKGNYTLLEGRSAFDQIKKYFEDEPPF